MRFAAKKLVCPICGKASYRRPAIGYQAARKIFETRNAILGLYQCPAGNGYHLFHFRMSQLQTFLRSQK